MDGDDEFDDDGTPARPSRPRRVKRGCALSSSSSDNEDDDDSDGRDGTMVDDDLAMSGTPRRVKRASCTDADDGDLEEEEDDDDEEEEGAGGNGTSGGEEECGGDEEEEEDGEGDGEDGGGSGRRRRRRPSWEGDRPGATAAGMDTDDGGDDDTDVDGGGGNDGRKAAASADDVAPAGSGGKIHPARYHVDQCVFAFDKGEIYEAVVLKTRFRAAKSSVKSAAAAAASGTTTKQHKWSYLVHFQGWSSRWDRWLDEAELRDDTAEVRAMAAEVRERTAAAERTRKQRAKERKEKKQRAKEARREARKEAKRRKKMGPDLGESCELPFTLRTVVVDDRQRIVRLGGRVASGYDDVERCPDWKPARLVHVLPAAPSIALVLGHYANWKRREFLKGAEQDENDEQGEGDEHDATTTREERAAAAKAKAEGRAAKCQTFVEGLLGLFNKALPIVLLYSQERTQYLSIPNDPDLRGKRPSELYGCEHLLRLFMRLPSLLRTMIVEERLKTDAESVADFGADVVDLVVFLQRNWTACFKAKYRELTEGEWTKAERRVVRMCAMTAGGNGGGGGGDDEKK